MGQAFRFFLPLWALVSGCATASAPAPARSSTEVGEISAADVQRWLNAWNGHDLTQIAALFTPDAVIHQPQNAQPLSTTTMLPFFAMVFKAFPDVHFESVGVTLGRGEATSWEKVTGTMLGPMTDPSTGRTFQPTGRRFEHVAAMRLVFSPDGRVREYWTIWDRAALATQLGLQAEADSSTGSGPITGADIDRWADAWNSHDIEKVTALFTSDVAIDQPENAKPIDMAGVPRFFGMIFKAYPDFHVDVRQAIIDRMSAVAVEQVTGTWSGPFVDPNTGRETPGNGRRFDHPGAMVLEYAPDHRVRHLSIYWDRLLVDRQLGINPK